jgi:hypothetical protein
MKIKARDIIAGWPRSRSTSTPWPDQPMPGQWNASTGDRLLDDDRTRAYHARQQDMLDEYIERYRRLTQHGECLLDPGYFIDIFGRRTNSVMPLRFLSKKD